MSEYTDYLQEILAAFGRVEARRMFGGHGLFHQGLMIGLVADEVLYLKTDAVTAPAFEARGLEPFRYARGVRRIALSFHQAPEEIFDDPDEAGAWAARAYEAALRSASRARKSRRKRGRATHGRPGRTL